VVPADITDALAPADITDPSEPAEPIENAEPNDPIEPIDSADPIEPTDSTEPVEPTDRSEDCDHSESLSTLAAYIASRDPPPGARRGRARASPAGRGFVRLSSAYADRVAVVIYRDSGKLGAYERLPEGGGLCALFRLEDAVDYHDDEQPPGS
jgi:hypothetical protein